MSPENKNKHFHSAWNVLSCAEVKLKSGNADFCIPGELLVPPHAPLCSWHRLFISFLDTRHQMQPRWRWSLGDPGQGLLWPRLSRRAPALHRPHWPSGGLAQGSARAGCWDAGEHFLPAGLRSPGQWPDSRLPAANSSGHQGKLLHYSRWFEWRSEGGLSEFTAQQDWNLLIDTHVCVFRWFHWVL